MPRTAVRCKQKGHGIIYCTGTENAVIAVELTSGGAVANEEVVETGDESVLGPNRNARPSLLS